MVLEKKNRIIIMDFSGAYRQEHFYEGENINWVEVQGLQGCNCYCDEDAMEALRNKIKSYPPEGIHFIDSGNYHYMSRIWMEKIKEPFRLVVFDNHTDMQPPAFGGLLSCGGWIADSLEHLPFLEEVILVGPSQEDFCSVKEEYKNKVKFLPKESLEDGKESVAQNFLGKVPLSLPVYISIDKDILCPKDAHTSWSQGELALDRLLGYLKVFMERLRKEKTFCAGVDICGEEESAGREEQEKNDLANQKLLYLFLDYGIGKEGGQGEEERKCHEK